MIIKRPRGSRAETPAALQTRLSRMWNTLVAQYLEEENSHVEVASSFPMTVNIGRPSVSGDNLLKNRAKIQEWIASWTDIQVQADIQFETSKKRTVGQVTLPASLELSDIDQLASFLGRSYEAQLYKARATFKPFINMDSRLVGLSYYWQTLVEMTDDERRGFIEFLSLKAQGNDEHLDLRELSIAGLDSKWVERRQAIVREALYLTKLLKPGNTFREEFGFTEDDRQEFWMKFHPDDYHNPLGDQEIAMRPSKIKGFPASITRVIIVENKATFKRHKPLPGTFLSFGSGNAIAGTAAAIPALADLEIIYWGDLDSFGMKILSRVRNILPKTKSCYMDGETMALRKGIWTAEIQAERFTGDIDLLTDEEEEALALIRSGDNRLEQERVRLTADQLAEIGLCREAG